ncbi:MAG: amidohydrolase [Lachnospiraceae bacterium]|nr:amidohydrolase [Lachnospiraceae bacterium]
MNTELFEEMSSFIDERAEEMKTLRQDFHKHAEAGWKEIRTCSIIADRLVKMGYTDILMGKECFAPESRMGLPSKAELDRAYERAIEEGAILPYAEKFKDGYTGVIAILETGKPGPVIGIRCDIDALGVCECQDDTHRPAREGFASIHTGEMHACGHDAHATIGLINAETFMKFKDRLCGTIKMVFQPAEEGVRGAKAIVDSGILDDVQYMLANHMTPRPKDSDAQLKFCYATCMANAKWDVYIHGKACHAAQPENGNNAMLAMAAVVQAIYGLPRASAGDARINVGVVQAGSGRNVVCDEVKMMMELRGLTQASLEYMVPYAKRIIEHAAAMHGCTAEIVEMGATPCHPVDVKEFVDRMNGLMKELGYKTIDPKESSTSEDYAYMAKRVQEKGGVSLMFRTLSEYPAASHSVHFDLQEEDLPTASKTFAAMVTNIMGITA